MTSALHPADPTYLGVMLSHVRFEVQHGREPTEDERLILVQERLGCSREEAEGVVAAVDRTLELEKLVRTTLADVLPDIMGGVLGDFQRRT
ncbi:hypothetical protein [Sphingomonas sp. 3-13AW]|uniref:hypothetical protein n=1 Tax=Sphingomonas sp. 3-13AW TaxID=3050450 RepID=UPI003BB54194